MRTSIIIPAFNEEMAIRDVCQRIFDVFKLQPHEYEMIVVDDGSTDNTSGVLKDMDVRVIRHPINRGYGASLKTGIFNAKYEYICITDADGTYPVDMIPTLLEQCESLDMVVGARRGKHYRGSFLKHPARLIFHFLVEFATGRHIPDANSGLRVFKREIVLPFLSELCQGFSFTTTITLSMISRGYMVKYIPIDYYARKGKSKVKLLRDSLRTTQIILHALMMYNPIKALLPLVVVLEMIAALSLFGFLIDTTSFLVGLCGLMSFFTGILIFVLALIADLIANTHQNTTPY